MGVYDVTGASVVSGALSEIVLPAGEAANWLALAACREVWVLSSGAPTTRYTVDGQGVQTRGIRVIPAFGSAQGSIDVRFVDPALTNAPREIAARTLVEAENARNLLNDQSLALTIRTAGGSANALTFTASAGFGGISSYVQNRTRIRFVVTAANTGAVTLQIDTGPAGNLLKPPGAALVAGDLRLGQIYEATWTVVSGVNGGAAFWLLDRMFTIDGAAITSGQVPAARLGGNPTFGQTNVVDQSRASSTEVGSAHIGATTTHGIRIGYDTAAPHGWVQAANFGSGVANLVLQPRGASLGVGVTPAASFHVAGNVRFDGNYESSASPFFYSWDGGGSGSVRAGFRMDGAGQTLQFFTGANERWRISTGGTLRPASGGALDLGEAGTRVRDIYTTNAVNVSSDDRLKDKLEELDREAVRTFVRALRPLRYVMRRGRVEIVEEEVPGEFEEAPATEEVEVSEDRVEMVDGRAVLRTVTRTETRPVFDDVHVYDEAGQPVMIDVPEERDEEGNVTRPASTLPRMHSAPRMVQRPKKRRVEVVTPGTRYHLGFRADEVYAAIKAAGWNPDFVASWGRNDRGDVTSLQWLRYDHFHAIWAAMFQALMDDNAALEARLAALEAA